MDVREGYQFKAAEFSSQILNLKRLTRDANDALLEARRRMELVEEALSIVDKAYHPSFLDSQSSQQSTR